LRAVVDILFKRSRGTAFLSPVAQMKAWFEDNVQD
jgi:hypothetical protein